MREKRVENRGGKQQFETRCGGGGFFRFIVTFLLVLKPRRGAELGVKGKKAKFEI